MRIWKEYILYQKEDGYQQGQQRQQGSYAIAYRLFCVFVVSREMTRLWIDNIGLLGNATILLNKTNKKKS